MYLVGEGGESVVSGPNPLSYNQYITTLGVMAVETTQAVGGVNQFTSPPLQAVVTQCLNYAELRIQKDLDFLSSQLSNTYSLTAGQQVFSLPFGDFFTVQTLELQQPGGGPTCPLIPVSKEFIQNCFGSLQTAGMPRYFAMYGDNFGDNQDTFNNILFGPAPSYGFTLRVTGTARSPSLYAYASAGIADTNYTYISQYLPDMLLLASMIFISMYQRNFSATSDSADMGQSYEKQYQIARTIAIPEENRRKQMGSAWSGYSTPVSATPTR